MRAQAAVLLLLLLVLAIAAAVASLAWWAVRSESGSAWLITHLPGVQLSVPNGRLLGDFDAQRIEIQLPGEGGTLVLNGVGWRGLRVDRAAAGLWFRVTIDELHATRVELQRVPNPSKEPLPAPASLRAPIALDVRALRIGELHDPLLGDKPLRDVQAGLHLGSDAGATHRVDALSFTWDRLRAAGAARIATDLPMALDAQLKLSQQVENDTTTWSADATLVGPLASPQLQAAVRAQPRAPQPGQTPGQRPAQSLDARATLRPFAAWPLGDLNATTTALDLSAFHSSAPATALNAVAVALTAGVNQPVAVTLNLTNTQAGRWNEGRLPLRSLNAELRGRVDDTSTLDLNGISADLGTLAQSAGRIQGQGRWTRERWTLDATLAALQPALLDSRAAAMQLSGPLALVGTGFAAAAADGASVDVKTDLTGPLADRGPARAARLKLDASVSAKRIEVRDAQALAGGARASLSGLMSRPTLDAAWQAKGQAALVDFDPSPWWPGREDSPWRKGPHRLNAKGEFDLNLAPTTVARPWAERLAALRGKASLSIGNSLLAGVPLSGEATVRSAEGAQVVSMVALQADGNSVRAEGRLSARANSADGASDVWDATLAAPALNRLAPLWRLLQTSGADGTLAGGLNATARVNGRWPDISTQGQLDGSAVRLGAASAQTIQARWQMGTSTDATLEAQATLTQAALAGAGGPAVEAVQLQLRGTGRAHSIELRAEAKALPPAWTEALQAAPTTATAAMSEASSGAASGAAPAPIAAPIPARAPATGSPMAAAPSRTLALLQAQGGLVAAGASALAGWRGKVQQLELRSNVAGALPWVRAGEVSLDLQWAGSPTRLTVQPGRAEVLGGALRWSRIAWQGTDESGAAGQLEARAELEPLQVAPLLARVQPDFGWGGDLAISGRLDVRSAPTFSADIVIERSRGDLTVTDETGTQRLGLTDLRLGLNVNDGVWSFTQGLAGTTLGVAAGAVVARTSPQASWPAADTPIQGVLELQVANLGTWGTWVPAGWRLGGELRTSATIAGRFGAPEYTGEVRGKELSVRNFLQGVNVEDGDVLIALQGSTARIERFTARAGAGTVQLEGSASLGQTPQAQLKVKASKFQLLGRVDRRIVTSGQAQLKLDREALALEGQLGIDEGLIDFTRSDAPSLSDDVEVRRARPAGTPPPAAAKGDEAVAATTSVPAAYRKVALDLRVALGEQLRLRGRGLDTGLRGELRITSPGGKLAINGSVSTVDGTYAAYGQKLTIDRGTLSFNGPAENPRLDIEATRPNTDVRVGVAVTGTAVNPRVRLFSEPELSDIDKLSWLVLGRASDGLGRTDTALLQRAALALLAGEGETITGQFTKAIGLDEVSLRQSDGEVRETVISLGKQLSRRWYVGYERGLNATAGTWQLIYRIAQRFTLRAQSGLDNSLDVIWTWRWQ